MDEDEKKITAPDDEPGQATEPEATVESVSPEEDSKAQPAAETQAQPASDSETWDKDGDELFVEMSEEERKLAEANERYVRLLADFDNYRKRIRKEREILRYSANEEIVLDLIPVIDNLERAVAAAKNSNGGPAENSSVSVIKGVELTLKLFSNVLSRHGVERITCVGEKFDPTQHEAISQVDAEGVEPETIVEEILPGYLIKGKVIRAAKVNVARSVPTAEEGPEDNE